MSRVLTIVSLIAFATALFTRAVDPIIPPIALDLRIEPTTVALLSTAFALPFALVQPILGPIADMLGKPRVMLACLAVLIATAFLGAFASSFPLLLATRIVGGMAAGGIFPVALAIIGDVVPVQERQIAIGRYLTFTITGNLLGSMFAGVIGDIVGWRAVFVAVGACSTAALAAALLAFRGVKIPAPPPLQLKAVPASYRAILSNPRAWTCYGAVFLEGLAIFGLFPYVALLLLGRGEARASIAGLILTGFALGGVVYALAVRILLLRFRQSRLMIAGGACVAVAMLGAGLGAWWPIELAIFAVLGFGFYMLHGCIQVQATEIAPTARGAAMALHSFAFFVGQAVGPVLYGFGFAHAGRLPTLAVAAVVVLLVGFACARLLGERSVLAKS
jgi:MFS transporter, DHA1 family, inner membrane transport protein